MSEEQKAQLALKIIGLIKAETKGFVDNDVFAALSLAGTILFGPDCKLRIDR